MESITTALFVYMYSISIFCIHYERKGRTWFRSAIYMYSPDSFDLMHSTIKLNAESAKMEVKRCTSFNKRANTLNWILRPIKTLYLYFKNFQSFDIFSCFWSLSFKCEHLSGERGRGRGEGRLRSRSSDELRSITWVGDEELKGYCYNSTLLLSTSSVPQHGIVESFYKEQSLRY